MAVTPRSVSVDDQHSMRVIGGESLRSSHSKSRAEFPQILWIPMSDTQQGPGWWNASDSKWYPPEPSPGPLLSVSRTRRLAIASFVLSLFWMGGLGSLLAIIFGLVALSNIKRSGGVGARGMAMAGVIIGILGLLLASLIWTVGLAVPPSH